MKAPEHLLIWAIGSLGLLLGTFLIDLDHSGSLSQKWECFKDSTTCYKNGLHRGFMHNPLIAFSIVALCFAIALGILIHLGMDYIDFSP